MPRDEGIMIDTPEGIAFFRLCTVKSAVKMETLGLSRGSRPSAYAIAKRDYGCRGNKAAVLQQLEDMIAKILKDREQAK